MSDIFQEIVLRGQLALIEILALAPLSSLNYQRFQDICLFIAENAFVAFIAFNVVQERKCEERITMNMIAHRELPPTAQDAAIARVSRQAFARLAQKRAPLKLRVTDVEQAEPIELPAGAVALLMDILEAMAAGRGVTIIPENAELTTVQAAAVLNVSRPFLIKLVEEGRIPYRTVGKHRRIRLEDVMSYKTTIDREREAILDQLAKEAQEQDLGYGK
jgi:excisionase family DNA binding protein